MSLNAARLGAAIGNAFTAAGGDPSKSAAIGAAIAAAIVTEIVGNAVVNPTALIAPGGLSPAPVIGTGTVT